MLRRLLCLFSLYRFGRDLARFKAQALLAGLPTACLHLPLTKKAKRKLRLISEDRPGLFLRQSGVSMQTLAAFFALYPDIAGRCRSDLLAKAADTMTEFADTADQKEQKQFVCLLKIFYTLAGRNPVYKQLAEKFEHLGGTELDFRFEAAALERLHDHFYEDDCLTTLLPDWPRTTKEHLTLIPYDGLRALSDSSDKEKTVRCLIKAVVLMILRDGFVVMPSAAGCRCDNTGTPYFIRSRLPVELSAQERLFLSSFLEALCAKDYRQAAKALLTSGFMPAFFPAPRLIRLIEDADRRSALLTAGQKADCFLKYFADNGIFLPFSLRYCVFSLKKTEHLCRTFLKAQGDIWLHGKTEFFDFLDKGKALPLNTQNNAADIRTAFGLAPHHAERLAIQNKKIPSFQEDPEKIPDILYRHTWGSRFQPRGRHRLIITLLILTVLTVGLFLI